MTKQHDARRAAAHRRRLDAARELLEAEGWIVTETVDLAGLTARLGLDPHEQEAVQSWTGERYGRRWTEAECQELMRAWTADSARIAAAEGYPTDADWSTAWDGNGNVVGGQHR